MTSRTTNPRSVPHLIDPSIILTKVTNSRSRLTPLPPTPTMDSTRSSATDRAVMTGREATAAGEVGVAATGVAAATAARAGDVAAAAADRVVADGEMRSRRALPQPVGPRSLVLLCAQLLNDNAPRPTTVRSR